jgi:hypothetical protein
VEKVKDQKIAVPLSFGNSDKNLILNGIRIASIFKKELCLLYNYSEKEKNNIDELALRLTDYTLPLKSELPGFAVSTLLISEKLSDLAEKLADDHEVILMVVPFSEYKYYSKSLAESPVPFLFTNENNNQISFFKNLILSIDLRQENRDISLWGSYFGRFNQSRIIVIAANDKGKDEQNQVTRNVALTKRLLQKFAIQHKIYKGEKSSLGNAFESLEFALSSDCDLLIILGSSSITPLDWVVGLPERKIIENAGGIPVLIVNPRKDNYILCD